MCILRGKMPFPFPRSLLMEYYMLLIWKAIEIDDGQSELKTIRNSVTWTTASLIALALK